LEEGSSYYMFRITLVATLGGFLFGYDTGVISGSGTYFKEYFDLAPAMHGFVVSSALIGCMVGSFLSGIISHRLGRRNSLILTGLLFLVSAIGSALPETVNELVIYRLLGGVGVGLVSAIAPVYIAEISPSHIRGKLVSVNQLAIVMGFLVVFFVNFFIQDPVDVGWNVDKGWRWMFASESVPALLFILLLFFVPRSPRFEVMNKRDQNALKILTRINGIESARIELAKIKESFQINESSLSWFKHPKLIKILTIGIGLAVFQQITGINAILYYGNDIFKSVGAGDNAAMLNQIVIGGAMVLFTGLAIFTVDRFGRKPLLLGGTIGMAITILLFGFLVFQEIWSSWSLIALVLYVAFFSFSQGPIVWVYISELFPNRIRNSIVAIAVFFQWLSNYLVSQTFPIMADENGYLFKEFRGAFPFWMYGFFCILAVFFIWRLLPETKSKSLEEMDEIWNIS